MKQTRQDLKFFGTYPFKSQLGVMPVSSLPRNLLNHFANN